jgi:hypothetical protein
VNRLSNRRFVSSCEVLEARALMSGVTGPLPMAPETAAPAVSAAEPVVAAGLTSDLQFGTWTWTLPSSGTGTAKIDAQIYNFTVGTGSSGSLGLELRLSTQPYGMGGVYYSVVNYQGLQPLANGYYANYWATSTFSLSSVPLGTYYIVTTVSEFTGAGYTVVDGETASSLYVISAAPPSVPVVPAAPDLDRPIVGLRGKPYVFGGAGYKFTMSYFDAGGLDLNSIQTAGVSFSDPDGTEFLPTMRKVKANRRATKCVVTYFIPAPSGKWYLPDNGMYTISLPDGAVTDLSGNGIEGGNWTFTVQSKKPSPFVVAGAPIRPAAESMAAALASVSDEILTGAASGDLFRSAA